MMSAESGMGGFTGLFFVESLYYSGMTLQAIDGLEEFFQALPDARAA
jgi:hypothetical protein